MSAEGPRKDSKINVCVVSISLAREWPHSEFSGNLWEQAIRSHTLPLGLAHIHTDAQPPFPFPSTQTEPRIPAWAHHSRVETAGRNGDFMQLAAVPAQTCATQKNTHFISHNKLCHPHHPPSLCQSSPAFCLPTIQFIPFPAPLLLFLLTFAAVENDDIHSVPPHILQNTCWESLDAYRFSKSAGIKSCSTQLQVQPSVHFRPHAQMIN